MTRPPRPAAWRRIAAGTVVALAAACSSTPPSPGPNAAQKSALNLAQAASRSLARGDLAQARAMYEASLKAAESVEDFDLAASALLNLALVQSRAGDQAAAHARLERILSAPQRYGPAMVARASARKALLHLDQPDLDAALRFADAAQAACAAPCELAAMLADLRAHVALQRGDPASAATLAARAAELASAAGQEPERANALRLLGQSRSRLGQNEEAASALAQALAIDRRLGLAERIGLDLVYAGHNEESRAQLAAAREFYQRALEVYRAAGNAAAAETVRARLAALPAAR